MLLASIIAHCQRERLNPDTIRLYIRLAGTEALYHPVTLDLASPVQPELTAQIGHILILTIDPSTPPDGAEFGITSAN